MCISVYLGIYITHNVIVQGGVGLIIDKITCNNNEKLYRSIINVNEVDVDVMKLKAALNYYNDIWIRSLDNIYGDVPTLLFCISKVIGKCNFTGKQEERLRMWMKGYTEKEIAEHFGISEVTVHNSLVVSCRKIAQRLKGEMRLWF